MKPGRDKDDILDRLEAFFDEKVQPRVKEFERLLNKEVELSKLRPENLIEYDPESPFSYVSAFLRDKGVASVAPSTKYLIDRVLKAMDLAEAGTVVEFGPAEGVMTRRILHSMPEDGTLLAIELNADFLKALKRIRDPRLRAAHGDVREVERHMSKAGLGKADALISGIPFSFFGREERGRLLDTINRVLKPGGRFVAFQYTTHLIPILKDHFRRVDVRFELRNLPPAFVFTCWK